MADPDFHNVIGRGKHLRKVTEKINETYRKSEDNGKMVEHDESAFLHRESLVEED